MTLPQLSPHHDSRPPTAWSRQAIYRLGFFAAIGLWMAAPTMYTTGGRSLETFPSWVFWGLFATIVVFGVLWWRENRRVTTIIYPIVGSVNLRTLPLINPLSFRAGLQTAALRWLITCASSLVTIFMLLQFNVGAWLLGSLFAMYLFVFGTFAYAAGVAFYIMNGKKRVDVHLLVQQFAADNGLTYVASSRKRGMARLVAMMRPVMTENWRLSGQYRQYQIEIVLRTRGDENGYVPVFELHIAGLNAQTMVQYEVVQDKLRVLDSSIDDQEYVIFAQFNEGAYSQSGMSRLFASLDVVIDHLK